MIKWKDFPNFSKEEFDCKETRENRMSPHFLEVLQRLRWLIGAPIQVTSGYRSPSHSLESGKTTPGFHAQGLAADIWVPANYRHDLLKNAFLLGFTGIGISHGRGPEFIHLDLRPAEEKAIWSY